MLAFAHLHSEVRDIMLAKLHATNLVLLFLKKSIKIGNLLASYSSVELLFCSIALDKEF